MYPNASDSFADSTGIIFLLIGVVGFVLSYLLSKIGVVNTDKRATRFVLILAGAIATLAAFYAGTPSANSWIVELGGRVALFAIVFFSVGAILVIGSVMGVEKADKSKKN